MNKKNIKVISDVCFFLAVILGGYAIIRTIINYVSLPPGVCPVSNYRFYIVVALIFAVVSIVLSWISVRKKDNE